MNSPLTDKPNITSIYKQYAVPLFQNKVYNSFEEAILTPVSDVTLSQCQDTGFVFNSNFDIELLAYDSNYQNEQSNSGVFQEHLSSVINLLEKNHLLKGKVVEIGCGERVFSKFIIG